MRKPLNPLTLGKNAEEIHAVEICGLCPYCGFNKDRNKGVCPRGEQCPRCRQPRTVCNCPGRVCNG